MSVPGMIVLNASVHTARKLAGVLAADVDRDTWTDEYPVRVNFTADLLVVTDSDLVASVVEFAGHGSPSVGASGPESRHASEPIVGAVSGVDSFGTPDTNPQGGVS